MKLLFFLFLVFLLIWRDDGFDFGENFRTVNKKCYHVCEEGACAYEGCSNLTCPGGGCYFEKCTGCDCQGGACVFSQCKESRCQGGSCEFRDPDETLKRGYCSGGNCYFEGTAFPDFNSFLSY